MRRAKIPAPITHDVVLIGGGHSHVQVLTAFATHPVNGVRLTLVTDRLTTPYSGMLPGHLAGLYSRSEMEIDLARLARATGTRLVYAPVIGLDRAQKQVLFADRPPLSYDALSINIGISPDLSSIEGGARFGIPVKPISRFLERFAGLLDAARQPDGPRRIVIVGGGAAGTELAHAIRIRLNAEAAAWGIEAQAFSIAIVSSDALVPTLNTGVRRRVSASLIAANIAFRTNFRVAGVDHAGIEAADGSRIAADMVLFATAARAPSWLSSTGLPLAPDGSVKIHRDLRVEGEADIFAVGDCAGSIEDPRPKAGVFAVRQGPVLAKNLRAHALGQPLSAYKAQRQFLTLLLSGERQAIAGRGRFFVTSGPLIWKWKDRIDRNFMAMFAEFGTTMAQPPSDADFAAKIGHERRAKALNRLPAAPAPQDRILVGLDAPDDAAIVEVSPGVLQVETIDQIKAFVDDAYLFGRIAALHAMNNVIAMGGIPTRALAMAGVPHGGPDHVAAELFQLLAGARRELDRQQVALIGCHSMETEVLSLGFSVTGRIASDRILRKSGVREGDQLILTKGLGTGIIMAADMRGAAPADLSSAAITAMLTSNACAGMIVAPYAHAMTDVTGFGLAGHLIEMLRSSGLWASIDLCGLPLLQGALSLAASGHQPSLTSQNAVLLPRLASDRPPSKTELALLFDPQTSGPLLVAIAPEQAVSIVDCLSRAGYSDARIIGRIEKSGMPDKLVRLRGHLIG